jgi:hypothetical protein
VFAEPCDEMEKDVNMYAPLFIVLGLASGIFEFSKVCYNVNKG